MNIHNITLKHKVVTLALRLFTRRNKCVTVFNSIQLSNIYTSKTNTDMASKSQVTNSSVRSQ